MMQHDSNPVFCPTEEVFYERYKNTKMLLNMDIKNFGLAPPEATARETTYPQLDNRRYHNESNNFL